MKNLKLGLCFVLISGMIAFLHGLGTGWDFLDYHYYNGYAFIHHRLGFDLAPAGNWTYYNPLLDSLNYLLESSLPAPLTTFLMGASCGLIGFFFYKICELLFQDKGLYGLVLSIVSAMIGLSAPMIIPGIGSVMNDLQSATPFMIALFLVLRSFSIQAPNRVIFLAGLLNGLSPALKLTNLDYAFSLIAVSFLFGLKNKALKSTAILSLGSILAFVLFEGFWMEILYQHFGNPFFPYFNAVFHSPYFPEQNLIADPRWGAHNLFQAFKLMFILTQTNHQVTDWLVRDWRFALVLILGLIWAGLRLFKKGENLSKQASFLIMFWALAYFIWAFKLGNYRFAAPLALLSGPLIVWFYYDSTLRQAQGKRAKFRDVGLTLLTVVVMLQTVYPKFNTSWYHGPYVEVSKPSIPDNAMVILTGPLQSFIAPFFPKSVRFVNPHAFPKGHDLSQEAILSQQGPLFILIGEYDDGALNHPWWNWTAETLKDYGLRITGPCQTLTSSVSWRGNFKLCPVSRSRV